MTIKFPLATPTWDSAEIEAMHRVIDSGQFTMGENVKQFESEFAKYIGSNYAVMSNSGSSANLLMIAALFFTKHDPIKPGDEVIVPAVSWSTTYFPLQQYGLRLRFVDIDINTLNYSLKGLEEAVSGDTKLIVCVNLLGNPNQFDEIRRIANRYGARIVEDNCESLGAEFNGKKAGTFGEMGSFSSFFSHHISTMEGGLTVTNSEELYHILICLRSHGWTRHLPDKNHVCDKDPNNSFAEAFRFVLPGYNLRPLELSGAIGCEQLKKLPGFVAQRRKNAKLFKDCMFDHPDVLIQEEIGKSSWFGFSMVIRKGSGLTRNELLKRLQSIGFECRPIVTGNFTRNDAMKYIQRVEPSELPGADRIHDYGLFIGNHHYPMDEAINALRNLGK